MRGRIVLTGWLENRRWRPDGGDLPEQRVFVVILKLTLLAGVASEVAPPSDVTVPPTGDDRACRGYQSTAGAASPVTSIWRPARASTPRLILPGMKFAIDRAGRSVTLTCCSVPDGGWTHRWPQMTTLNGRDVDVEQTPRWCG